MFYPIILKRTPGVLKIFSKNCFPTPHLIPSTAKSRSVKKTDLSK